MVTLCPEQYNRLNSVKQEAKLRLKAKFGWGFFLIGAFAGEVITSIIMDILKKEREINHKRRKGSESKKVENNMFNNLNPYE